MVGPLRSSALRGPSRRKFSEDLPAAFRRIAAPLGDLFQRSQAGDAMFPGVVQLADAPAG